MLRYVSKFNNFSICHELLADPKCQVGFLYCSSQFMIVIFLLEVIYCKSYIEFNGWINSTTLFLSFVTGRHGRYIPSHFCAQLQKASSKLGKEWVTHPVHSKHFGWFEEICCQGHLNYATTDGRNSFCAHPTFSTAPFICLRSAKGTFLSFWSGKRVVWNVCFQRNNNAGGCLNSSLLCFMSVGTYCTRLDTSCVIFSYFHLFLFGARVSSLSSRSWVLAKLYLLSNHCTARALIAISITDCSETQPCNMQMWCLEWNAILAQTLTRTGTLVCMYHVHVQYPFLCLHLLPLANQRTTYLIDRLLPICGDNTQKEIQHVSCISSARRRGRVCKFLSHPATSSDRPS